MWTCTTVNIVDAINSYQDSRQYLASIPPHNKYIHRTSKLHKFYVHSFHPTQQAANVATKTGHCGRTKFL